MPSRATSKPARRSSFGTLVSYHAGPPVSRTRFFLPVATPLSRQSHVNILDDLFNASTIFGVSKINRWAILFILIGLYGNHTPLVLPPDLPHFIFHVSTKPFGYPPPGSRPERRIKSTNVIISTPHFKAQVHLLVGALPPRGLAVLSISVPEGP